MAENRSIQVSFSGLSGADSKILIPVDATGITFTAPDGSEIRIAVEVDDRGGFSLESIRCSRDEGRGLGCVVISPVASNRVRVRLKYNS